MAKEQAAQSLDPVMMVLGSPVYAEDSQAVIKQANWAFGNRPMCHINQVTGKRTGGAATTPSSLQIEFRAIASGSVEVLRFYVEILPETVSITAGAECYMLGGEGSVKFTIGASSQTQTFSHASGHSGVERTLNFATSATGTGWQLCTIEVEKTSGTSDIHLSRFRIQDDSITSSLPDPVIEGDNETMDIQEEGSAVVLSARKLNFVGADITASSAGGGVATVNLSTRAPTVDSGTAGTTLTTAQNGQTVILTNAAGFVTLPSVTASDVGAQFVIINGTTSDNAGAIRGDGSDNFYDNDTTGGETANQQIDKMKAKTVVCFAADSWMVIG